jgi:hypothetical protein
VNTRVVNKRTHSAQPGDVYIGRPGPWGNEYSHRPEATALHIVGSVEEAIEGYRTQLWCEIEMGRVGLEELAALHGKTLVCWCKPGPCHGDVLAAAAAWAVDQLAQRDETNAYVDSQRRQS